MADIIAIFLGNLHGGGAEKAGLRLAESLVKAGFKVDLVLGKMEGPYITQIPPGVRVVHFDTRGFFSKILRLKKYLRKNSPKLLFSILTRENVIALLAKLSSRVKTPVFISERCAFSPIFKILKFKHKYLIKPVLRFLYPRADGILAVSNGVADDLSRSLNVPRDKIQVIYNPIPLPEIREKSMQVGAHPWCSFKDRPLILAVGRLTQTKDFLTLIEAFAILTKEIPSRLLILGEGEDREKLERKVLELNLAPEIQLPGFVENPYCYMAQASVLAVSSRCEGLANVLIEAMACGTPVVSTDCPSGPAEVLNGGEFGPLVPIEAPTELAQGILRVLKDPLDKDRLRGRAEIFSQDRIIKQYVELIGAENPAAG